MNNSSLLLSVFRKIEQLNKRYSKVGDAEFFSNHEFLWVSTIESKHAEISKELHHVLSNLKALPSLRDISPDFFAVENLKGSWKTFFFFGYGHKFLRNCDACPKTTAALEAIPGMKTAFFSILYPGSHIPPHRGPFNGVLRLHLGLLIPKDRELCVMRVGTQTRHWESGKCLVFDDTYEHEAYNKTSQLRVVLFVDFKRPLPFWMNCINTLMLEVIQRTPFVKKAAKGQKNWEEKFYDKENY